MKGITERYARSVVETLQEDGYVAYYAGGCVRDLVRKVPPSDYDIATNAPPEAVQKLFSRTVAVGAKFGVVIVLIDREEFEVATFRSDGAYADGRRPEAVIFSTPERDASRRDFTVNGMFYDPIRNKVIDYVGGRKDLESKILRTIGNARDRFREDHLRLLRAVRFAVTLDFQIYGSTWSALREAAHEVITVSAERIRDEIVRIFLSPNRLRGFDLLDQSGLMSVILPEIEALKGCEQPPQWHPEGDVFVHTRAMIGLLPEKVSVPLVFSVLFHDIGKPATFSFDAVRNRIRFSGHDRVGADMTRRVMERLRFSRHVIDATVEAVAQHMVFKDVQNMRVAKLKRFMSRPHFDDEMELHRVDCASSHRMLENYDFLREKQEEFANEPLIPAPLISGWDLLALGWKTGPRIGEVLEAVQTRQLEGTLTSRDEALDWVRENFTVETEA